jgi:hypothetical protein
MHLGLASAFKIVMMLLRFLAAILSFGAFYTKPSTNLQEGLTTESVVLQ